MQLFVWSNICAGHLGLAHAHVGRAAEALPVVQEAVHAWSTSGARFAHALFLVALGEVHRLAGRSDDALAAAQEALAGAIERKERGNEAAARRLLGDVAVETEAGDPTSAVRPSSKLEAETGSRGS